MKMWNNIVPCPKLAHVNLSVNLGRLFYCFLLSLYTRNGLFSRTRPQQLPSTFFAFTSRRIIPLTEAIMSDSFVKSTAKWTSWQRALFSFFNELVWFSLWNLCSDFLWKVIPIMYQSSKYLFLPRKFF